jgi:CheY-like chemotaxis protein
MKPNALVIDDDNWSMKFYVKLLQKSGVNVIRCFSIDETFNTIPKLNLSIAAIIIDFMMPPGDRYKTENTNNGLFSGMFLYNDIHKVFPKAFIFVLTNLGEQDCIRQFKIDNNVEILQKLDYPPKELVDYVLAHISEDGE